MLPITLYVAALFGLAAAGAYPPDIVDQLAELSLPKLKEYLAKNPQRGLHTGDGGQTKGMVC
jgi:tyrosinase